MTHAERKQYMRVTLKLLGWTRTDVNFKEYYRRPGDYVPWLYSLNAAFKEATQHGRLRGRGQ